MELTEKQKSICGLLILSFRTNYQGKKIQSAEILEKLKIRGFNISSGRLRDIIGHIRKNDLCSPGFILSDTEGYWYSEDADEMQRVWKTNYGRAVEIMKNFAPLSRRFKHLINERESIFQYLSNEDAGY